MNEEDNVPTLLLMSSAQVAISILNNSEIRDLIKSYVIPDPSSKKFHFRSTIEAKAQDQISKLTLPPVLQNLVTDSVRPMISQMSDWKQSYGSLMADCAGYFTESDGGYFQFFWKLNGQLDHQKIAKTLVENENVDIRERFLLACYLCLIDDGLRLWSSMTPGQKGYILLEVFRFPKPCSLAVSIFTNELESGKFRDELDTIESRDDRPMSRRISDMVVLSPVKFHNVFMLRHVLEVEPQESHRRYLLKAARSVDIHSDMMRFCLSHLSINDQRTIYGRLSITKRLRLQ